MEKKAEARKLINPLPQTPATPKKQIPLSFQFLSVQLINHAHPSRQPEPPLLNERGSG